MYYYNALEALDFKFPWSKILNSPKKVMTHLHSHFLFDF